MVPAELEAPEAVVEEPEVEAAEELEAEAPIVPAELAEPLPLDEVEEPEVLGSV